MFCLFLGFLLLLGLFLFLFGFLLLLVFVVVVLCLVLIFGLVCFTLARLSPLFDGRRDNRVPPPCNRPIPNCAQFISPDFPVRRIADREPDPQRNRPPCSFYFTCANSTFMGYQLCPPGKTFTRLCPPVKMRRLVLFARCLVRSGFHKQSQSAEDGEGGRGVVVMVGELGARNQTKQNIAT